MSPSSPILPFQFCGNRMDCGKKPLLMAILNITPDSFSDGGKLVRLEDAVATGVEAVAQGADILDVGGESTRPGYAAVSEEEEIRRVLPVIRELAARVKVPISVDTMKAAVAAAAIQAGATIVNDVSGDYRNPAMLQILRDTGAGYIFTHHAPISGDPAESIAIEFADALAHYRREGLREEQIVLDPGIGFGKNLEQNVACITGVPRFRSLNRPVLIGASRKSFLGALTGVQNPAERDPATAAAVCAAIFHGADIFRVHNVLAMRQVLDTSPMLR